MLLYHIPDNTSRPQCPHSLFFQNFVLPTSSPEKHSSCSPNEAGFRTKVSEFYHSELISPISAGHTATPRKVLATFHSDISREQKVPSEEKEGGSHMDYCLKLDSPFVRWQSRLKWMWGMEQVVVAGSSTASRR